MTFPRDPIAPGPLVIGHRGVSGHRVENSRSAFELAAGPGEWNCDGVELDIHAAADGTLVVHHDPTLPSGRQIADVTGADLEGELLADGTPVPTLPEALRILRGLHVFVEAKTLPASSDAALLELLRREPNPERMHVHAFDHRVVARLHRKASWLSLGILSCSYPVDPLEPILKAGASALWQQHELIDADLVARCATAGVAVIAWTVNTRHDGERLARIGVSGLCGNHPERLRN